MGLTELFAVLALIAGAVAAFFRGQSKRAQLERDAASRRAESAEAVVARQRREDSAIAELEQNHREEDMDAQARLDAGRRDHLDGDW